MEHCLCPNMYLLQNNNWTTISADIWEYIYIKTKHTVLKLSWYFNWISVSQSYIMRFFLHNTLRLSWQLLESPTLRLCKCDHNWGCNIFRILKSIILISHRLTVTNLFTTKQEKLLSLRNVIWLYPRHSLSKNGKCKMSHKYMYIWRCLIWGCP